MHVFAFKAAIPAFALLLADPILEVLDRVAAHTKLDEV
jgi:hypothetical protein